MPSQYTLQDQQVGPAQSPLKSVLLLWVPVLIGPCVHPPRVESDPQSCGSPIISPFSGKAKCFGGSSSQYQTPALGSLAWGSEHSCARTSVIKLFSSLWVRIWNLIISQVWLSYHFVGLLFVFGYRISFLKGSNLFIHGCLAISCDFGVLVRGGRLKFGFLHHLVFSHIHNTWLLLNSRLKYKNCIKDFIRESWTWTVLLDLIIFYQCQLLWDYSITVMQENVHILQRYVFKYLRVKCYYVCSLLLHPEKLCICGA